MLSNLFVHFPPCIYTVVVLVLTVYAYIYMRVSGKSGDKKIWVPPKPKPTLPFGLGPAPEPVTAEEYEATTYKAYETKLIKEGIQSILMSGTISFFMSMKFGPMSMLIQSIMMPINLSENVVFKKYLLGVVTGENGTGLYNEEESAPSKAAVAALNVKYGTAPVTPADSGASTEPRVTELKDDDSDETDGSKAGTGGKGKKGKNGSKDGKDKQPKATPADELD